jgi:hypothetical protein
VGEHRDRLPVDDDRGPCLPISLPLAPSVGAQVALAAVVRPVIVEIVVRPVQPRGRVPERLGDRVFELLAGPGARRRVGRCHELPDLAGTRLGPQRAEQDPDRQQRQHERPHQVREDPGPVPHPQHVEQDEHRQRCGREQRRRQDAATHRAGAPPAAAEPCRDDREEHQAERTQHHLGARERAPDRSRTRRRLPGHPVSSADRHSKNRLGTIPESTVSA